MQSQKKRESFINALGKTIPQLFVELEYKIPGESYSKSLPEHNKNHSLFQYVREVITYFLSNKFKQLVATLTFRSKRTLNSVYSQQSTAILANSINIDEALLKGLHYNIPLIQIVMLTPKGQAIIKEKVLLNFTISHLINQNFILYGDWERNSDLLKVFPQIPPAEEEISTCQGMYFRKGELVYGFLPMEAILKADQQILEENLIKLRNAYFQFTDPTMNHSQQRHNINQEMPDIVSDQSEIIASSSMFRPRNPDDFVDNFNDSDEQLENLPQG